MVLGVDDHEIAIRGKGDTGWTTELALALALNTPFGDKTAIWAEPGNPMGRLIADKKIAIGVGNELYRPDKLTVARAVTTDLLELIRLLGHILKRPDANHGDPFGAA